MPGTLGSITGGGCLSPCRPFGLPEGSYLQPRVEVRIVLNERKGYCIEMRRNARFLFLIPLLLFAGKGEAGGFFTEVSTAAVLPREDLNNPGNTLPTR